MNIYKRIFLTLLVTISFASVNIAEEITIRNVAQELMCVNCPSELASACQCSGAEYMQKYIAQALKEGKSKEEIKRYFVEQHGEKILSTPLARGFNLLAWILPIVGVLGGLIFILLIIIKWVEKRNCRISTEVYPEKDSDSHEETKYRERLLLELEQLRKEDQ